MPRPGLSDQPPRSGGLFGFCQARLQPYVALFVAEFEAERGLSRFTAPITAATPTPMQAEGSLKRKHLFLPSFQVVAENPEQRQLASPGILLRASLFMPTRCGGSLLGPERTGTGL